MHNSLCKLLLVFVNVIILSSCAVHQQAAQNNQSMLIVPGFEEPLVPIGEPSAAETKALKNAIARYFEQTSYYAGIDILNNFIQTYPDSAWRVSLQLNLGIIHYRNGAFSESINSWEDAWNLGKSATDLKQKAMVDRAYGELTRMHARLGHAERIEALLEEAKDRTLIGSATETVAGAKEGLWVMHNNPGIAYLCGPAALGNVLYALNPKSDGLALLGGARSGKNGFNLNQVNSLAKDAGMSYQMAKREGSAPLPLPVVVHWKVNHYAAVVGLDGGQYHLKDPTFGGDLWVPKEVLDKESSGYFLIPQSKLGEGWLQVASLEAETVFGMGYIVGVDPDDTKPCDPKNSGTCPLSGPPCECDGTGGGGGDVGMPRYDVHSMLVSLNITDTPVGYKPSKGPAVYTTLTYNQREANQTGTISYSNLGPKWTFNWLSYIQDNPYNIYHSSGDADVKRLVSGGGGILHTGFNTATNKFTVERATGAVLERVSDDPILYKRYLKNGAIEEYSQSDGATNTATSRRVFLTKVIDRRGHALELSYDSQLRLVSIEDAEKDTEENAEGQTTTFDYTDTNNSLLLTKITDPFERTAQLAYDTAGRLVSITDAEGMTSSFEYDGSSDFIASMKTPYGEPNEVTTFEKWQHSTYSYERNLKITDPSGNIELTEYDDEITVPNGECTDEDDCTDRPVDPDEMDTDTGYLLARNTLYWDKHAYTFNTTHNGANASNAVIMHWVHGLRTDGGGGQSNVSDSVMESYKSPKESRIWFNYPDQPSNVTAGLLEYPSFVGRKLDDGTTQLDQYVRNAIGKVTCHIDPTGGLKRYEYETNLIDLKAVYKKASGACTDSLETFTKIKSYTYTGNSHLPATMTEYPAGGSGNTTSYTYTSDGQVHTVTNPSPFSQVTTYTYAGRNGAGSGAYLHTIEDANGVDVATYTYDVVGRVKTVANAEGYAVEFEYDDLNRVTKMKYLVDDTFVGYEYDNLDLVSVTDRHGDVKEMSFDNVRNLISQSINYPAVWEADYKYYKNGTLKYFIDGVGNVTAYVRDVQSRVTQIHRGPASSFNTLNNPSTTSCPTNALCTQYVYETKTSRLKKIIDPASGETEYTYDKADRIKTVIDANNHVTTYSYNGFGELETQVSPDTGTTTYTYDNVGNLATKTLAATDTDTDGGGPDTDDTLAISYSWDALRRLTGVDYPGTDQDIAYSYDTAASGEDCNTSTSATSFYGRLCRVVRGGTSAGSITDYIYNALGRITAEKVRPAGSSGIVLTTQYAYNTAGELTGITYPGGRTVAIPHDDGRITAVASIFNSATQPLAATLSYQPFGGISGYDLPNDGSTHLVRYQQAYNLDGRISQVHLQISSGNGHLREYDYDAFGNISAVFINGTGQGSYEYDALNRLKVATAAYGQYEYEYDNVGNRTEQTKRNWVGDNLTLEDKWVETYLYETGTTGSNRLLAVDRKRFVSGTPESTPYRTRDFEYDARGNIKKDTRSKTEGTTTTTNILDLDYGNSDRLNSVTVDAE